MNHSKTYSIYSNVLIEIQQDLKNKGIKLETEIAENTKGPGSFAVLDPDGNVVLIDQHV